MLSVTGMNRFYYLRGFTDMRCKHSRVLSVIREQLHREPSDGDIYIVMSKDRRIVRLFAYDNRSYILFEKKFVSGYQFMLSTVKLQGRSTWDYLGKFFTGIFNGCRDFLSLAPQNIDLAVCQ